MPSENFPARLPAADPSPAISRTSATLDWLMELLAASAARCAGRPARVEGPGFQQSSGLAQRPAKLTVGLAADAGVPGVRGVQAEDHAHGGGLA
jgi:hypothetical protein